MKAARIVLLVFGIIFVLGSLGLLIGGGVLLAFDNNFKDNQGFYASSLIPVSSGSSVITTQPADIQIENAWLIRNRDRFTFKVEAVNSDTAKPVFVGIARESDLNQYLNGVAYDTISDMTYGSSDLAYIHHSGNTPVSAPTDQKFWVASSSGTGTQSVTWDIDNGSYTLVVMNADGTSPVDADISLGIKTPPIVKGVGIGLVVAGVVFLAGGVVMIFFGARGW